ADPLPPQVGEVADGAAVDQVLAHHPGQVTVARPGVVPVGDEADRQAAAQRIEQGRAGVDIRHVDLAGRERRDHLAGALKGYDLDVDSQLAVVTALEPD